MTSFYKELLRLSGARYVDGLATGHFFPSPSQCLRPTRFSQFSMPLLGEWLGLPFTVHIHHPSAPITVHGYS